MQNWERINMWWSANGAVFLAVVHSLGKLPESEMQEIGLFEELPENLTYPDVTPRLIEEARKYYENQVLYKG